MRRTVAGTFGPNGIQLAIYDWILRIVLCSLQIMRLGNFRNYVGNNNKQCLIDTVTNPAQLIIYWTAGIFRFCFRFMLAVNTNIMKLGTNNNNTSLYYFCSLYYVVFVVCLGTFSSLENLCWQQQMLVLFVLQSSRDSRLPARSLDLPKLSW